MTAIIGSMDNPCVRRMVTTGRATFELREWPLQVARFRSVIENRDPVSAQGRDARGRFGKAVLA